MKISLEDQLEQRLKTIAPCPLRVTWHENHSHFLRIMKQGGGLHLHLHRLFLEAPSPVLEALIRLGLKNRSEDKAVVRQMAHLYFSTFRAPSLDLDPAGAVYDLEQIFRRHEKSYFLKSIDAQIGWSILPKYKKFRSITFGSFDRVRAQIRINPLLDSDQVPDYFVEFIVYHEMLHAVCPATMGSDGRSRVHTPEFRRREKLFAHFERAKEWEQKSLQFFKKKRLNLSK